MTTTTRPNPATPGRKVGARACVDDFFSDLSAAVNGGMKVRERYAVLGRVLRLAVDQRLEGVKVCFAGLYPKIQYLVRECRIRENSKDHTLVPSTTRATACGTLRPPATLSSKQPFRAT